MRDLPILSPHGHVDARHAGRRRPLRRPGHRSSSRPTTTSPGCCTPAASRWPTSGVGARRARPRRSPGAVWRLLCEHWHLFRGTPSRYWLESSSAEVFDVTVRPSAQTADAIYDQVAERLAKDAYRPRALFERFGIEVLATTDDPCDDLAAHAALAADPGFAGRVLPTFRPDRYLEVGGRRAGPTRSAGSARSSGVDTGTYAGWVVGDGGPPARTSARTAPSRPTTATRTSAPSRWPTPRPTAIYRRGAGRHASTRRRPWRCAGTCCSRWPACPATTAW